MEHILEEIRESIEWPMIYPQIYQELNAKPSKGNIIIVIYLSIIKKIY